MKFLLILTICVLINVSSSRVINVSTHNEIIKDEGQDPPPDYKAYAKMARYLVHNSNWTSMGTISSLPQLNGYPMVNVISIADSAKNEKSTGNIYFYITMLDFTAQDLSKHNKLTTLFSMDQTLYCSKANVDPMEPTCARTMISGSFVKIPKNTEEFEFATNAMLSRHPASPHWIHTHDFFLCKLDISQIVVLDYYGGPHFVKTDDYFNASLDGEEDDHPKTVNIKLDKSSRYKVINIEI